MPLAADVTVIPLAANASFEPGRGADLTEKYPRQNKGRFRSAAWTRSHKHLGQHKMEERLLGERASDNARDQARDWAAEPALSCAISARHRQQLQVP